MYQIIRPLLFKLPAEKAHHLSTSLLKSAFKVPFGQQVASTLFNFDYPGLQREYLGLKFRNPVGLAAGFDKDASLYNEMASLGFGFVEIGTVTPKGQEGNPRPRLFRLPQDKALINRLGFNNKGVKAAAERLRKRRTGIVIGGNIGKNKATPNENAIEDYLVCLEELHSLVDYFTVNVSSPNTPNLRALQDKEPLTRLLQAVMSRNSELGAPKPVLLKIAPDLNKHQLDDILQIVEDTGISGIIATNTTIARNGLHTHSDEVKNMGAGGLSGQPLKQKSTEVIRHLYEQSGKKLFIIGAGGIFTAADAIEKLQAGAKLLQVYTGFVYEGPGMVKKICSGLLKNYGEALEQIR